MIFFVFLRNDNFKYGWFDWFMKHCVNGCYRRHPLAYRMVRKKPGKFWKKSSEPTARHTFSIIETTQTIFSIEFAFNVLANEV